MSIFFGIFILFLYLYGCVLYFKFNLKSCLMKAELVYGSHDFRSNNANKRIRYSTRSLRREQKIYFSRNKAMEESVRMGGYEVDVMSSKMSKLTTITLHPMREFSEFWID